MGQYAPGNLRLCTPRRETAGSPRSSKCCPPRECRNSPGASRDSY